MENSNWNSDKLGSVIEIKYGKDHKKLSEGNFPCLGSGGIMRYVDSYLYDDESILIPRKGSLNNIMFQDSSFWTVDTMFWSKIDKSKVFPKYLFYQLTLIDYENLNVGSAVPSLTVPVINEIEIQLPPLPEQKAIASVLSSLDDKIDLLHQQNQTLEALAETLFRQWFIEEAKEEWKDCTIGDLANHSKISVHPNKNPDTLYHHYSIPAFDANKKPVVELGKEIQSNKYKVENNSILFSKLNPHKDKRVWLIQDSVEENAICSTELQVVKPKDKDYLYFIYGWLTNSIYYNEIASGVGGTSGSHQRIEPKAIFTAPCVKIEKDIILQYNSHAEPLFKKQFENQQQIQTLTQLRNTLLPKLMSGAVSLSNCGEVRVKN
ncbi:restriction endonuclease subunit S [Empedobacter falsenii]